MKTTFKSNLRFANKIVRATFKMFIQTIVTRNGKIVWKHGGKHRGSLQKNMAFPEGNELFAGDFRANLDETNADMVQFTKRWNWE